MGWITNRRNRTGKGIGGYVEKGKGSAPLKKIVEVLKVSTDMFGQNRVLLECGHTANSNGANKARCLKCKKK